MGSFLGNAMFCAVHVFKQHVSSVELFSVLLHCQLTVCGDHWESMTAGHTCQMMSMQWAGGMQWTYWCTVTQAWHTHSQGWWQGIKNCVRENELQWQDKCRQMYVCHYSLHISQSTLLWNYSLFHAYVCIISCLQCCDAVDLVAGRTSGL